jgi:hypothetical protein
MRRFFDGFSGADAAMAPRECASNARIKRPAALFALSMAFLFASSVGSAQAVSPSAGFTIDSFALPSVFSAADNAGCHLGTQFPPCDSYRVSVTNAGSVATQEGTEVTLADTLPAGVTLKAAELHSPATARLLKFLGYTGDEQGDLFPFLETFGLCTQVPLQCVLPVSIAPDERVLMRVFVTVDEPAVAGSLTNSATVSGGGVASVSTDPGLSTNRVGGAPAFGPGRFGFSAYRPDGLVDSQAGDHPYELTTTIGLGTSLKTGPQGTFGANGVEDPRDVVTSLPVGFVGSILAAPQCTFAELSSHIGHGVGGCPSDTIVGHISTEPITQQSIDGPIYNMTPERGAPAEFAYVDGIAGPHVFYARVVPTSKGYVLQATNPEIPQISLNYIVVTFYGDPAAKQEELARREGKEVSAKAQVPFFTNPTNCTGEEPTATIYMDSWQHPARFNPDGTAANLEEAAWAKAEFKAPPVTGCNLLRFPAEIGAQPTTRESDKPSGMEFEIKVPQSETVGVPATPTMKKAVVTLPEGFTVNPAAGNGLAACSVAQIGWLGGTHLNFSPAPPQCPEASKIGSLELETPLVPHKLEGEMFLAAQDENPFNSTLAAYVVVDDPITGVLVKIAGEFLPDPHTGRLTAVFDENPNLPFSDLKLHFFGGPRAELATPESCGAFTTTTELSPYSAPDSGPPATPFDSFLINEACPGGFAPTFTAGSLNLQAGAFTPFVASFGRSDTDQELAGLTLTLPPGLLGKIAGVPLCGEADANAGACPAASQVGTVKTGVGPGPNPLFVGGKAYLTGPYNGGPYGLSIVVPAVAGPYNFGTVVVRQSLRIDPRTAQVTDVSDPFPTIIAGIPLRLRRVDVTLDREGFTFNPTNCSKLAFNGNITGSPLGAPRSLTGNVGYATQPGSTSPFATSFQVSNCATLGFKPDFKVSVSGKSSKANGAGLSVKLAYPNAPFGSQANIGRVKVELPVQLPSRLTTLQQACLAATFDANPAKCPAGSIVGHAKVITPLLPAPLEGPAYFVSHGGEAFPDLTIVLKGNGVTVQLVGTTFISKKGITSTTFKSPPDVPFDTFELTLPQGKYSALASNIDLCTTTHPVTVKKRVTVHRNGHTTHPLRTVTRRVAQLLMPTEFTAQNGAHLQQNTKIAVSGCGSAKKGKKANVEHKHKKH